MKVLHVISAVDPRSGGPTMALSGLALAQMLAGLRVTIVACFHENTDHTVADALRDAGVEVRLVGPCQGRLSRHKDLTVTMTEAVARADIVHIHSLWEEIQHQAARAAQRCGRPYIIRPCGMLDPWSLAQNPWRKRIYLAWRMRCHLDRAAAIHFTAEAERDACQPLQLRSPPLVEPLGVDLSEFESLPPKGALRAKYPQLQGRPVVVFLGRLHPGKGMEYLIPAMAQLRRTDAALVAIGPDSKGFRAVLEAKALEAGISDRVIFTGPLWGNEKIAALRDADLFCLPSEHENFGIAVVEAMAAGCPVVISDQVSIFREIIEAGAGTAVPLSVDRLADEIRKWLADPSGRETAAAKARSFVHARYDWRQIALHWRQHYEALIARTGMSLLSA